MASNFESLFGDTPFGLRRCDDGHLVHDEAEQEILAKLSALKRQVAALVAVVDIVCERASKKGGH
jgi:hypothetical protein